MASLGGLAGALAAPQAPPEEPVFPVPTESIELRTEESATFDDLLRQFCQATGVRVVVDQETRQELGAIPLDIYGDVTLPPDELYPVVESMLYARGFIYGVAHRIAVFRQGGTAHSLGESGPHTVG